MQTALLLSSLLMGVLGGSHCLTMCGAACIAIARPAADKGEHSATTVEQTIHWQDQKQPLLTASALRFQLGRLLAYAAGGAVAAASVQALAWGSQSVDALRHVWIVWHALVLVLGLMLLVFGRTPIWAQRIGGSWLQRLQASHWLRRPLLLGCAWILMPCGFLYAALLQASLTGNALQGALAMLLFALGSALWLLAAPALWIQLKRLRENWGQRVAGLLLLASSVTAIYLQFQHGGVLYCYTQ